MRSVAWGNIFATRHGGNWLLVDVRSKIPEQDKALAIGWDFYTENDERQGFRTFIHLENKCLSSFVLIFGVFLEGLLVDYKFGRRVPALIY